MTLCLRGRGMSLTWGMLLTLFCTCITHSPMRRLVILMTTRLSWTRTSDCSGNISILRVPKTWHLAVFLHSITHSLKSSLFYICRCLWRRLIGRKLSQPQRIGWRHGLSPSDWYIFGFWRASTEYARPLQDGLAEEGELYEGSLFWGKFWQSYPTARKTKWYKIYLLDMTWYGCSLGLRQKTHPDGLHEGVGAGMLQGSRHPRWLQQVSPISGGRTLAGIHTSGILNGNFLLHLLFEGH